jgi:spore cortex biosynthesis protein YabQ
MEQVHFVVGLTLCGALMGTVFDLYNTVTGASKWLKWMRPILDLSFWVLSAVAAFYVTFVTDDGRFRVYTFGLLLLGYALYRITLHRTVVGSAFTFVSAVGATLRFLYRIIDTLMFRPLFLMFKLVRAILRSVYRILCRIEDGLFWVIRSCLKLIFLPIPRRWRTLKQTPRIFDRWEGLWQRASNWLKKDPERT